MFWDFTTWFVIFVRFSAYLLLFPITAAAAIPVIVRLGFAGLGAFLILPLVPAVHLEGGSIYPLIRMFFLEASTGLILGLLARFLFYAVEIAGSIIATESGLMMSANLNPITSSFGSSPGVLLHWMTLILMLTLDLHHWLIIGLQRSYEIIPAGGAKFSELLLSDIIGRASGMFVIALQMTAPILATSFLVTMVFSLLGRAVPQMNVFNESFPVRTIAGLAVFGLTCNLMGQHIVNHLNRIPGDFIRVAQMLGS
ncbi:MAG: flagellar biosynthetic protein FliR [Gloeobacteraceae cyanobacterium ES-bin-144]|nr:flagellar biosynthetic protein FliR [Verrucomicrobiales bacterium]